MFGLGMPELVIIMGITFMVFGGKKLPELGAGLGKGIKAFKTGLRDVEKTVPALDEVKALKSDLHETEKH
ncbi:MAG: twin-arginine translocase TatA/TatE family subunit [Proteobacteria bacterium]|nr:twin-arginine translocase TatA/TatE family subunit [Desulfobulbaceae bacterium]MBU4151872.1 twin-arginine translocase TatA/TatE family subunit [Pseudomonadota bacterium]